MYQIYIRHFYTPRSWLGPGAIDIINEGEVLMYEIPSSFEEECALIDPKVKAEMGKAGSFEFGMEQNNLWYSSLVQLKTLIRVKYDDETIFYGRVLAIDTDMWGKRKVHCEGALAFLLDTMFEASKEEDRKKISVNTYVKNLIDSHNNVTADEPNKRFEYGEIPGYYSQSIPSYMKPDIDGVDRKFGAGSWTSTLNCLEDLTSKFGGYLRARYNDSNGKLYLDWLKDVFNPDVIGQPLELTENVIAMSNTVDVNGIFTVLIPEGSKNGQSLYLDHVPKSVTKVPLQKKKKTPIGPGLDQWTDHQGVVKV